MDSIEIPLTKGYSTIVSCEDADLAERNWCASVKKHKDHIQAVYAVGWVAGKMRPLHRVILARKLGHPVPFDMDTDHIDGNPLNNTRENLRLASHAQNIANGRSWKTSSTTSPFRGVSRKASTGRWTATIVVGDKQLHLGYFDDPAEAARAYDRAAQEHFGSFARLNGV